jgi:hypothetical protein
VFRNALEIFETLLPVAVIASLFGVTVMLGSVDVNPVSKSTVNVSVVVVWCRRLCRACKVCYFLPLNDILKDLDNLFNLGN